MDENEAGDSRNGHAMNSGPRVFVSGGLRKSRSTSSLNSNPHSKIEKTNKRDSKESRIQRERSRNLPTLTLWQYLLLELRDNDSQFNDDRSEQLINFLKVPVYLERVVVFGMLACFDSFLYTFTILPLRFVYSLSRLVRLRLNASRRGDLVKGLMVFIILYLLLQMDTSKIYHNIRGQAAIKLYVMFNVLEIADKLCSAIGQDILESLLSTQTLAASHRIIIYFLLATGYCYLHSMVLLYQVITLNVAINSYSNALLTLLLSNQFSEIKSTVFKKFERENLFQLTCADIAERFQLLMMLMVIGVRNLVEVSNEGIIPNSWMGWNRWLGALFGPAAVVVGSEIVVDWLKHAYVIKFNNIRPRVYRKFLDVLVFDYWENAFNDQIMTRRIGLPVFPLVCVFSKMMLQSYYILAESLAPSPFASSSSSPGPASPSTIPALERIDDFFKTKLKFSHTSMSELYIYLNFVLAGLIIFLILVSLKLLVGALLLKYSMRRHSLAKDRRPSRRKSNLYLQGDIIPGTVKGYGVIELNDKMRQRLFEPEESVPQSKIKNAEIDLNNVTRFKMVAKRIW